MQHPIIGRVWGLIVRVGIQYGVLKRRECSPLPVEQGLNSAQSRMYSTRVSRFLQWLSISLTTIAISLCFAAPASAAIAYVQGNTNGVGSGTSVATQYTSAQTAGDINIVVLSWVDTVPRVVSVTDSMGNVYSKAISTVGDGTTSVYYAKNIAAAGANANRVTATLDSSEPFVELSITEYSGMDTASPLDVAVGGTGTGTLANSGSVVTANSNDLLFGNAYVATLATTAGSGYAKRFNTYQGDGVEDETVTSTGSYSASMSQSATGWYVMQLVAFKAASGTQAPPDTTPPTAPTNLTTTAASSTQINLSWTASTDNVGVTGYKVERCTGISCSTFAQIATPTITSYSDASLTASTSYSYRVRATDAAGNLSGYSSVATVNTQATSTTPTAIAYVQGNTNGVGSGASVSTKYTSAQTAGDINIVVLSWVDTVPRVVSMTDSMGNVYSKAISTVGDGTTSVYYAKNIAAAGANANTVTVTMDSGEPNPELSITEYSGIDTVNPLDVAVGGTGTGTLANSGSVVTANSNDLLFGNAYVATLATTAGSGYAKRFNTYQGDGVEDETVTSTGSYSASMSQSATGWYVMQLVAFKAASGQAPPDTTPPTAPTNLTTTAASSTQINLSWTASTDNVGVTGYKVERCTGISCSTFVQIATPATTTYSDTSLTASTSYSYRVRATDAAGNLSGYSSTATTSTPAVADTTPPTAPTNLTTTAASSTQINLSWTASTDNVGVTGYKVERCSGASCSTFAQIATPTTTTYSDTGLTASTSYSYRIRATDAAGNLSAYSSTSSATTQALPDTTAPSAPTGLTATATSSAQVNLSWTASTDNVGVTGYKVERCSGTSCSTFAQIATPTTTTYSDTSVTASTSYSYRIRATDAAGNLSSYSNTASATTQAPPDTTPPSAPSGLSATTVSSTQINLSWAASTDNVGVTGYLIERCAGSGCSSFTQIGTSASTGYSDSGLTGSTAYSYRIRATDAAGNLSSYSNTASATTQAPPDTTPPSVPTSLGAVATSGTQVTLSWNTSTDNVGVTGYKLERCTGTSCSSFTQIVSLTTTSYSDAGLSASTTYTYRVRATDAAGNLSGYSNTASATTQTPPGAPTGLTITASSDTEVDLAWNAASGSQTITSYQVLRCQGAGCSSFSSVASVTTLTDYDSSLSAATSYSYEVVAVDSAGNVSAPSSAVTITTVSTVNSCK